MKRVVIHIDRLVLKGFRQEDRYAIAVGLQQELGHVFANREAVSLLSAMGDVPRLQVGGLHIEQGSMPQGIGEQTARGIGKGLKK